MSLGFIRLSGDAPLYQQLYSELRRAILEQRLRPGARLPSTRSIAQELSLSRNVVLLAFDQLRAEGYIDARRGSGSFVAEALQGMAGHGESSKRGRLSREAVAARPPRLSGLARRSAKLRFPDAGRGLRYDFRYGNVPRDELTERHLQQIIARRARHLPTRYATAQGAPELRRALARYLSERRGLDCDPDRLLVTGGSQQGLDLTARMLLDPGDEMAMEEPGYGGARTCFAALGACVVPVPVDAAGMRVSLLAQRAPAARLCYVTPSHQFPTGAILPLPRRLALVRWARERGAYLLEDDYDGEFRYDGRPIEPLTRLDGGRHTIYLGTFSKVLSPALRIGYLLLPEPLVEPALRLRWLNDRHGGTLIQTVIADLIESGQFERHLRRTRRRNAERRAALLAAVDRHLGDRVALQGTEGGAHLVMWLRGVRATQLPTLIERASAADVGLYPITPYYARPPRRAGILLGYTTLTERAIAEGISRLASLLA